MLSLVIPTLVIFAPLIILILVGSRKGKIQRIGFWFIIAGCFLLGLIAPIVATFISARALMAGFEPGEPKCITGVAVFLFFGYAINLIGIPVAGLALSLLRKKI